MNLFCLNVGHADAQARREAAALSLAGGAIALPAIARPAPWLLAIVGIVMVLTGRFYVARGMGGAGTWLFGGVLVVLGIADWLTGRSGHWMWGLILGIVFALAGILTTATGRCVINTILGVDTRRSSEPAGPFEASLRP